MHTQLIMTTGLISAGGRMQYVSCAHINLIMNAVYIYVYNNANDNPQAKVSLLLVSATNLSAAL